MAILNINFLSVSHMKKRNANVEQTNNNTGVFLLDSVEKSGRQSDPV